MNTDTDTPLTNALLREFTPSTYSDEEILFRLRPFARRLERCLTATRAALEAVAKELECPARNTTITSHRRDGSVIISNETRAQVIAALAKADALYSELTKV
jgi:hypothetical protein